MLNRLLGYHLRRAVIAVYGDLSRALAGTGIRQNQFGLLAILDETPGIRQGEMGKHLSVQRTNIGAVVSELVTMGLIDRQTASDDRRALALYLTAKGKAVYQDCLVRIRESEEAMLADFSDEEREALFGLLVRLAAKSPQRS